MAGNANLKTFNGLFLAFEEKPIKSYHCSSLTFPACEGHLTVTNKRVIFHGSADNSRIMDAVQLDKVSGISTFYGSRWIWQYIIWGVICSLIALWFFSPGGRSSNNDKAIAVVMAIIAVALFLSAHRQVFHLKIYSSQAMSAPITVGEGYGSLGGNNALYALIGAPTSETDKMMLELDPMIHDLQSGDREAIARWVDEDE
jgi:hypothetical protein